MLMDFIKPDPFQGILLQHLSHQVVHAWGRLIGQIQVSIKDGVCRGKGTFLEEHRVQQHSQ